MLIQLKNFIIQVVNEKKLIQKLLQPGGIMTYIYLGIAIVFEIIATASLKASESFTNLLPSIVVVCGYIASFYFFSIVLKTMPVGTAYAIWCGLGIMLTTIVAAIVFKQIPDLPAIIGMSLILCGVVVINLFSKQNGI